MAAKYDTIGVTYANLRQPDPRIATLIDNALGPANTVLNVGAGAGSYEPTGRKVTALDPSEKMIRQRPPGAAPCIKGVAENLPFDDNSFDASMAILTLHHWSDKARGLAEMRRVTRGLLCLAHDNRHRFPYVAHAICRQNRAPPLSSLRASRSLKGRHWSSLKR